MKKILTLFTLLSLFLGANAIQVVDIEIDYSEFEDGDASTIKFYGWGASESARERLSIKNGCLHFESTVAIDPYWDCQFHPIGGVEAEEGVTYTLHYKVKGSVAMNISAIGFGITPYGKFPITTEWVEGIFEYTAAGDYPSGDLLFQCGDYVGEWDIAYLRITHEERDEIDDWATLNSGDSEDDAYLIYTVGQLKMLANLVNTGISTYEGKFFKLMNNLNYTDITYTPVGNDDHPFCGTFDGNDKTISNVTLKDEEQYRGIFGYVGNGGTVKRLTVNQSSFQGKSYVGSIAGRIKNATISNCHNQSHVSSASNAENYFGGIVGYAENSTIDNCQSSILAYTEGANCVGGIVGGISSGTVSNCFNFAEVSSQNGSNIGGIVGYNDGAVLANNYYAGDCTTGGVSGSDVTENDGAVPVLRDAADNTTAISLMAKLPEDGYYYRVQLIGRTLYKDGAWNTLCLPFDILDINAQDGNYYCCSLHGATVRPLSAASITGTTLNLTFGDAVTSLDAGVPYIIKWTKDDVNPTIDNPVFRGVFIDPTDRSFDNRVSGDGRVRFIGTYKSTAFDGVDNSILLLDEANTLYYPPAGASIGAMRAYFKIGEDDASQQARMLTAINIDFGEEEPATGGGVFDAMPQIINEELINNEWYMVDGRKLASKPTRRGFYIHQGRKVVVK